MSGRVLKAGTPEAAGVRDTTLVDARREARRILAEAEADAARLRGVARAEADLLRAQAAREGREQGIAEVTELLAKARVMAAESRRRADAELRALAVKIAERILGRELKLDPAAVVDVAHEALRAAGGPEELIVRVHPDDVAVIERGRPRLAERMRGAPAIAVRADERVERGGCILETPLGVIDARLDVQLAALERALAEAGE